MEIELGNSKINIKNATNKTLEKVILEVIKTKHPKREEILNYYFKKNKMKPHKKLNNDLSFVECSIKYDDHDTLCKYVKNLTLCAPSFNIINSCVEYNKVNLLQKYIKEKRINIEQCINENTPLITAMKKKQIDCFNILIQNGCKIYQPNSKGNSPICNLFSDILIENNNGSMTDENKVIYENFIDGLLPTKIKINYENILEEIKIIIEKHKNINPEIIEELQENIKLLIDKNHMIESDIFEVLTDNKCKRFKELTSLEYYFMNKYNILYSSCETSKLIKMAESGLDTFVNLILKKRPYMLSLYYDEYTVFIHLFNMKNENIINNIITNYSDIVLYNRELLNYLVYTGRLNYVKTILSKYPDCANQQDESGKTFIDAVILSQEIEHKDKIEYIDYFISIGTDINNSNNNDFSTTELAIQYESIDIVEHIIKFTSSEIKKKDILHLACCFEKPEILKLLVDNDFMIDFDENTNFPSCLQPALKLSNFEIVKYILEEPKFRNIQNPDFKFDETYKQELFDYAIISKSTKNILCLLNDDYKLNHVNDIDINDVNDKGVKYNVIRLNGIFDNFVNKYTMKKTEVITTAKMFITMLLKFINNDAKSLCKRYFFEKEEQFAKYNQLFKEESELDNCHMVLLTYENIRELTTADFNEILTRAINGNVTMGLIDTYKDILINNKDKLEHYSETLTGLMDMIINIDDDYEDYEGAFCPCCGSYNNEMVIKDCPESIDITDLIKDDLIKNEVKSEIKKFQKSKKIKSSHKINSDKQYNKIIGTSLEQVEQNSENYENSENSIEEIEYVQIQPTQKMLLISLPLGNIEILLSRLTYPFVMKNYDVLKKLLSQKILYYEDEYKFNIIENDKLVAMVYKNSKDDIPKWIDTYGYNICIDSKMDSNHMFTFGIDILLFDLWNKKNNAIKCKYKLINAEKHATCIYIYGKALVNNKWERGYFEYFLNDKNVLFHRLFKPKCV